MQAGIKRLVIAILRETGWWWEWWNQSVPVLLSSWIAVVEVGGHVVVVGLCRGVL
jgi:hypothetical protein